MRRRRRVVDLDAPDHFTVLASSETGHLGAFQLLAVKGSRRASASIDGDQLAMLGDRVLLIIDELERRGLVAIEVGDGPDETPPLAGPSRMDIAADTLAVEWDDDGDRLIIEAIAAPPAAGAGAWARSIGEPDATELPDDDPLGPDILRVRLTPLLAQRFARRARRLAARP
jgi:hypothetical protein